MDSAKYSVLHCVWIPVCLLPEGSAQRLCVLRCNLYRPMSSPVSLIFGTTLHVDGKNFETLNIDEEDIFPHYGCSKYPWYLGCIRSWRLWWLQKIPEYRAVLGTANSWKRGRKSFSFEHIYNEISLKIW